MKLTYAGKTKAFTSEEQAKLDNKLVRLGKLVERKGERVAHVAIKSTRHLHRAEIAMRFEESPVVGIASATDVFQAVTAAVDKLEKQVLKLHEKHREAHRLPPAKTAAAAARAKNGKAAAPASAAAAKAAKVYRVDGRRVKKPMTMEEAMIEIGAQQAYLPFPDADTGQISVLIRRADGHFDLVEC